MTRSKVVAGLAEQIAAVQATPTARPSSPGDAQREYPLPDGGDKALAHLVRSVSQRPITVAEARAKLLAREHPEDVVTAVVARAVQARILDDTAFATAWVDDRGIKRGYGRARLLRELRKRKVCTDVIEAALARMEDHDEVAQATALARARAQRMPGTLEPSKVAQRLVGFLLRRGYTSTIAHDVARRVTAMDRDWD